MTSEQEQQRRELVVWLIIVVLVCLVVLVSVTGCSGISQAEWDDLQSKHQSTLDELEAAEDERQQAIADLKRTRAALVRAEAALREIAHYLRTRGQGGILPW